MLQSVYLFKERVLIVLGLFVQPGIVLHTHCTVQDSQDCVSESLSLDDATYSRVQPWLNLFYLTVSANAWLFQPVHSLSQVRP